MKNEMAAIRITFCKTCTKTCLEEDDVWSFVCSYCETGICRDIKVQHKYTDMFFIWQLGFFWWERIFFFFCFSIRKSEKKCGGQGGLPAWMRKWNCVEPAEAAWPSSRARCVLLLVAFFHLLGLLFSTAFCLRPHIAHSNVLPSQHF